MEMMRISILAVPILLAVSLAKADPAAQGAEWQFAAQSAQPIALPAWLSADSLRRALSYEAPEVLAGFRADLNHDGTPDYVFRFSRSTCGSNCEYALLDGRTRRTLGTVGGSVLLVGPVSINGYPVIRAYGHSSAEAGNWSTSVFNGREYESVGTVYVEGSSQASLFASFQHVPFWPPDAPTPSR